MIMRRGFTIVELIITITIMGILMILAVVNVNATQTRARDDERKADVAAIASALESYYRVGTSSSTSYNRYPATTITASETTIKAALRDANMNSFMAPSQTTVTTTFTAATNAVQTTNGILPQPTVNQYIYQPIDSSGALCTSSSTECRKYNLYYRLESDNGVYKVTSKNQ